MGGRSHWEHHNTPSASASRGGYLRRGMVRLPFSEIGVPRCTVSGSCSPSVGHLDEHGVTAGHKGHKAEGAVPQPAVKLRHLARVQLTQPVRVA